MYVTEYSEDFILAHAEARANMQHEHPTEANFAQAEREIRDMIAVGMTYTETNGWA